MMALSLALGAGGGLACIDLGAYQCASADDCNLNGEGVCAPDGFCAYPSGDCPSGFVYQGAGGRDGECLEEPSTDTMADGADAGDTGTGTEESTTSDETAEGETGEPDMPIEDSCGNMTVEPGEFCLDPEPEEIDAGFEPFWVVPVNFDDDDTLDLVLGNRNGGRLTILLGNGDGTFEIDQVVEDTLDEVWQVATGDIDGDSDLDVVVADRGADRVKVFLQGVGGTLEEPIEVDMGENNTGVLIADLDGDGLADLAAVNNITPGSFTVALGDGAGGFPVTKTYATNDESFGLDIADLDGDGPLDVVVTNRGTNDASIFTNNGLAGQAFELEIGLTFTTGLAPSGPLAFDLDDDGDKDLVIANLGGNNASIYDNTAGAFSILETFQACSGPGAPSIADVNQDGKPDVLIPCLGGDLTIGLTDGNGLIVETIEVLEAGLPASVAVGDFNADGAADFATTDALLGTKLRIFIQEP